MKPSSVFVVFGTSGCHISDELSDEWNVISYGDIEQANAHRDALAKAVAALYAHVGCGYPDDSLLDSETGRELKRLDPTTTRIKSNILYHVTEIPLFRHFDEFQGLE